MEDSGISITFKYGKGYEEPWLVLKGGPTRVRADLLSIFGIPEEVAAGKTLNELLIFTNHLVHGTGNVATILGGTPIAESPKGEQNANQTASNEDPWASVDGEAGGRESAAPAPAENPNGGLLSQIANATTTDELKRLWAANKAAFSAPDVTAAYSAKGKSLTPAA